MARFLDITVAFSLASMTALLLIWAAEASRQLHTVAMADGLPALEQVTIIR